MKKIILILITCASVLCSISCEDNVNPKTAFNEVYALNCILRGDTTFQMATISHTYDVDGFDPNTNTEDPFIGGAKIKITYGDSVFDLRDSSVARPAGSRYNTPLNIYYTNKLKPDQIKKIKIEAVLPNGKVLSSSSESYTTGYFFFTQSIKTFPEIGSSEANLIFTWRLLQGSIDVGKMYLAPELAIVYYKNENGNLKKYEKKVPSYYLNYDTKRVPIYPEVQSGITTVKFDTLALRNTLMEISQGDPDKQNYLIDKAVFRLLVLDESLASYYSSGKIFFDEFTVRLNQPDVTNINGGLGIFGTYNVKTVNVTLGPEYVSQFGYSSKLFK